MDIPGKSSILLSIFKRKGREGLSTKIINESNIENYNRVIISLEDNEIPLIVSYINELNWFLLTNLTIKIASKGVVKIIHNGDIVRVQPALQEEHRNRIMNPSDFTRLSITDTNNKEYIITIEKGEPYIGIFQVLSFIATGKKPN